MQVLWGIGGTVVLLAIAILVGVGGMAPSRRSQIARFGIRALIAGTLANLPNAVIAGMLVG